MNTYDKKTNKLFYLWLVVSMLIVFIIIIVGGLTRLTDSGLSITEWELFKGILPPLDKTTWQLYFDRYKTIPQYKLLNQNMQIEEFKIIFYWEYFHRILARIIGLFFLIPLVYFYFTKKISDKYLSTCYFIFFLISLQGLIGWYMVKSGLINDVTVSHYRLSMHLVVALIIISSIFWLLKNFKDNSKKLFFNFTKKNFPFLFLILLIFIQIILGAFVSGLNAGQIFQTWPLMGNTYFPDDINHHELMNFLDFDNHSIVQFYHRNTAYLITFYIFILSTYIFRYNLKILFKPLKLLLLFLILQIILGILTLISGLNIYLASAHQISSVILVFTSINLYFYQAK